MLVSRPLCKTPPDLPTHSAEPPTYILILQVYSPEVLQAFGKALVGLLRDTSIYMQAMQAAGLPHDTMERLPRLVFLLLQNPLNSMIRLLSNHLARVVVAAETCSSAKDMHTQWSLTCG